MLDKNIIYVVPEFPKLSETFVISDLFGLLENGFKVEIFSLRKPAKPNEGLPYNVNLKITYLYDSALSSVLRANLRIIITRPQLYLHAISYLFSDFFSNIRIKKSPFGLFYRFFFAALIASRAKHNGTVGIHAQFAHVAADIAMYAGALSKTPFSFTAHANDLYENAWLLREKISRSAFSVTISEYNKKYMSAVSGCPEKIRVVRCGISIKKVDLKKGYDLNQPMRIGTVGRLVEKKGMADLVSAMAILKLQGISVDLEILGDGPLKGELQELARKIGVDNQVFFGGAFSHDHVLGWLCSLDAFALACKSSATGDVDGIPVSLMEAMAAGVPVVSTQVSGIPELVTNNVNGLLVSPSRPYELARAIRILAESKNLREDFGRRGRATVLQRFTAEQCAAELAGVMAECY